MEPVFSKELFYVLLFSSVITTFAVSAINTLQSKLSSNWLVFLVSILVTFTSVTFNFTKVEDVQDFVIKVLLNMSFSILFYNYLGKWFVDTIFIKIKEILSTKLQKNSQNDN